MNISLYSCFSWFNELKSVYCKESCHHLEQIFPLNLYVDFSFTKRRKIKEKAIKCFKKVGGWGGGWDKIRRKLHMAPHFSCCSIFKNVPVPPCPECKSLYGNRKKEALSYKQDRNARFCYGNWPHDVRKWWYVRGWSNVMMMHANMKIDYWGLGFFLNWKYLGIGFQPSEEPNVRWLHWSVGRDRSNVWN